MQIRCLKITMVALALAGAALAEDRALVVIQGQDSLNQAGSRSWTLCEAGHCKRLGSGAGFTVPPGQNLVVTEAAFTVRGGATAFSRAAAFVLTLGTGEDAFDLAEISARLLPHLANNTVTQRFSPGLTVPAGAVLSGWQKELQPGGGRASLDVRFYGFLVPKNQPSK